MYNYFTNYFTAVPLNKYPLYAIESKKPLSTVNFHYQRDTNAEIAKPRLSAVDCQVAKNNVTKSRIRASGCVGSAAAHVKGKVEVHQISLVVMK